MAFNFANLAYNSYVPGLSNPDGVVADQIQRFFEYTDTGVTLAQVDNTYMQVTEAYLTFRVGDLIKVVASDGDGLFLVYRSSYPDLVNVAKIYDLA